MLDPGRLHALRRELARIETGARSAQPERILRLGPAPLDAALGGGLALGAVHEIGPAQPMHLAAATGFAVALARRAGHHREHCVNIQPFSVSLQNEPIAPRPPPVCPSPPVLWIQQDYAGFEAGRPYGLGLALFGLPMARLVVLTVRHTRDALWAMEEALKSGAVSAALLELIKDDSGADLTASRRLSLAAAEGGALGLVLTPHASDRPSAAMTRWQVAAAPGARDAFGGLGPAAFALSLVKNRRGPTGRWLLLWDHHECAFAPTLSLGVAQAARDRSDRALLRHAG